MVTSRLDRSLDALGEREVIFNGGMRLYVLEWKMGDMAVILIM